MNIDIRNEVAHVLGRATTPEERAVLAALMDMGLVNPVDLARRLTDPKTAEARRLIVRASGL